jgi:hypothetical protein
MFKKFNNLNDKLNSNSGWNEVLDEGAIQQVRYPGKDFQAVGHSASRPCS